MRALIVDDEGPARNRLRRMLEEIGDVDVAGEAADGREAVTQIRTLRPAIVFLDVQMPGMTGFDVLTELKADERPPAIVFVTAYDAYALRAFEVSALDYLLKPYDSRRLRESVNRARSLFEQPVGRIADPRIDRLLELLGDRHRRQKLTVRSRDGVQLVNVGDIDWLQSEDNYTILHLGTAELRIRETLTELEKRLESNGFLRIHRSLMVNEDRIVRLEPWSHGEYVVILRNGTKLRTGRSYSASVEKFLT